MDIRLKDGQYAGQVRDAAPEVARALLADGRAELPCADQHPDQVPEVRAQLPEMEVHVPHTRKRRK